MSKTIDAVLWKIGPDFKARLGANKGEIKRLFIFKELNTNDQFKANVPIDGKNQNTVNMIKNGQEGNVFFGLQTQEKNPKNIDVYKPFNRIEIKEKNRAKN